jgi:hypothetical protein
MVRLTDPLRAEGALPAMSGLQVSPEVFDGIELGRGASAGVRIMRSPRRAQHVRIVRTLPAAT